MKTMHATSARRAKRPARRAELFVLVPDTDDTPVFSRVTEEIGKPLADVYERRRAQRQAAGLPAVALPKPVAVCGMRVSPDVVAFSFNRLSKVRVKTFMTEPLELPVSALARLERNLPTDPVAAGEVVLELLVPDQDAAEATGPAEAPAADVLGDLFADDDTPAPTKRPPRATKAVRWTMAFTRDDAGIVSFDDDGEAIAKPAGPLKVAVYLRSPLVDRTLAVSYFGFFAGRPDQPETKARLAAQVLHLAAQLGEFRALSGMTDVLVPARPTTAAPAGYGAPAAVTAAMPVALYRTAEDVVPFAQGTVEVEVDLVSSSDRLLFHLRPDAGIAEVFEPFRHVAAQCVTQQVEAALGPEALNAARAEIILGELTDATVDGLRHAVRAVTGGAYLTANRWAPMAG